MQELFSLGAQAGALLLARKETLAVAETSAGGLISSSLLAVPGASAYFVGGAITYSFTAIRALVDLDMTELRARGIRSSSEPYAKLLAARIRTRHGDGVTWGLAETGAAGPSGNPYGDPPGHTCLAIDGPRHLVRTVRTGNADRLANMQAFAEAALRLLIEALGSGEG